MVLIEGNPEELPSVLEATRLNEQQQSEFEASVSKFFKEKEQFINSLRDEMHEMMPALLRQLAGSNPFYQRQAIRYLGEIGPEAKAAVPALVTLTRSDDKFTRQTAIAALKGIDPRAAPSQ